MSTRAALKETAAQCLKELDPADVRELLLDVFGEVNVLISGNPCDGFRYVGPFFGALEDSDASRDALIANELRGETWWLKAPEVIA